MDKKIKFTTLMVVGALMAGCGGSSTPAPVDNSAAAAAAAAAAKASADAAAAKAAADAATKGTADAAAAAAAKAAADAAAAAAAAALTFTAQEKVADQLFNKYINDSTLAFKVPLTPAAQIPLTGSSTYDGKIALFIDPNNSVGDEDDFVGNANVVTNFSAGNVTGSFKDFVNKDEEKLTGSLAISGGSIERSNFGAVVAFGNTGSGGIEANWAGVLTDPNDDSFAFNGNLAGEFLGPNREGLVGAMTGGVNTPSNTGVDVGGFFVTEQ